MYTPLKVTTDYTLLKSLIKIDDLIAFLIKNGLKCCAICDENLFGVMEFYTKCLKNNIKPIIGMTIILNDYPVYLYAKNYVGYKNLLQIHSIKQLRLLSVIDLQKYSDNMVVILPFKSNSLYESLSFFPDLYIGYQNDYEKHNAMIFCDNVIFVNDLKAFYVEDLKYLGYLDLLRKEKSEDYSYNYYLQSNVVDEGVIDNFTNLFDLVIPQDKRYIPVLDEKRDSFNFLQTLAYKGLEKRLKGHILPKYEKRLNYELNIIKKMGFVDYFLIVYDYILYAKKNDILVGPGRGSAAGSLVSYSIGITEIDPLKYDLLFERFLNPARVTMPDIDVDFDANKREIVINYVKEKYGKDNVALGITFNTLKSKLVIREVGKLLNIDQGLIEKFVNSIKSDWSLKDNLKQDNVKTYLNHYDNLKKVYEISLKLEGIKKNISTHAAGVVISSVALDEVIPICINNGVVLTGVPMEYLEVLGLLKMDFLGLKNLTMIDNILKKIGKEKLENISLEDEKVYKLFQSGKTEGIFQFETPALKNIIVKLKPTCFNDLIAGVALGRPGPKEHVESFIRRKNGLEPIVYVDKSLEEILKETYGIIIYQEQIMAILVKVAGYTFSEADLIRRAISKKKEDVILNSKNEFVEKAILNGYKKDVALKIIEEISNFASYGFNKSHSVAYALIAYQMAYLKANYPAYFIMELLEKKDDNKNNYYLAFLKQKGIKIYKPSVNNESLSYEFKDNKIIMPLGTIKNISNDIALKIKEAKDDGYSDFFDFVLKTKDFLNIGLLEILIHAGTMDCFSLNHQTLVKNSESALNYADLAKDNKDLIKKPAIVLYPEYNEDFLREKELELYGFYITNHPASKYYRNDCVKLGNINRALFKKVKVICLVDNIKEIKTKKGENMAFFTASDETGSADFTVFPLNYKRLENIKTKDLVMVFGEVQKRFDKISIIVNNISKMED